MSNFLQLCNIPDVLLVAEQETLTATRLTLPADTRRRIVNPDSSLWKLCMYSTVCRLEWLLNRAGNSLICSFFFGERPERFAHGRSFLVSDLSNSLTSLIFGERPERFTHIAHQKRGNERFAHFFNNFFFKSYIKHTKTRF